MFPVFQIDIKKNTLESYSTHARYLGTLIGEPGSYIDIQGAIRGEAERTDGAVLFLEFMYCGMSTGTIAFQEAREKAADLAARLVAMCAQLHRARDEGTVLSS